MFKGQLNYKGSGGTFGYRDTGCEQNCITGAQDNLKTSLWSRPKGHCIILFACRIPSQDVLHFLAIFCVCVLLQYVSSSIPSEPYVCCSQRNAPVWISTLNFTLNWH